MPKYTPRMVKVKTKQNKVEVKQISLVVEQLQLSCTAGREQKSVELLWKTVQQYLLKMNILKSTILLLSNPAKMHVHSQKTCTTMLIAALLEMSPNRNLSNC